jgi:hypothetical protein
MSAPTYFGSAAVPADNVSNATLTLTITPPASMQAGDLVVVICHSRPSATWSNAVTGGQTWTAETAYQSSAAGAFCRIFWCVFNGTWAADPRFDCTVATVTSAVMHVFRPDSAGKTWGIDVAQATTQFAAPTTPFTVTRTGLTNVNADTVTLACFHSGDDNTWGSMSGTGWVLSGSAQYRNAAGTQSSCSFAHHLDGPAGSVVPNVSKNQATLGGDLGVTAIIAWYAYAPISFTTNVSDDFNRADSASLGSNWTEIGGNTSIVSNKLKGQSVSGWDLNIFNTAVGVNQYVRITPSSGGSGAGNFNYAFLRYTDASTPYYAIEFNNNDGVVKWYEVTGVIIGATTETGGALSGWGAIDQPLGVTIEGTGNNTVIRIWANCSGIPSTTTNWNGDTTPDMILTGNPTTPANTGTKVGCGFWQEGSATPIEDFFGGGDGVAAAGGKPWHYYQQQRAA